MIYVCVFIVNFSFHCLEYRGVCAIIRATYGCAIIGILLVTDIIGDSLELHHYLCHFREFCLFSVILGISWDIYHCSSNT